MCNYVQIELDKNSENPGVYAVFSTFVLLYHIPPPDEQFLLPSYIFLLLRYFTALPKTRCHCEERSDVAISSRQLVLEIATPVCALVRNDSDSRQLPTIILQITLLVSVNSRRLYRKIYFFKLLCYHKKQIIFYVQRQKYQRFLFAITKLDSLF